MSEQAQAKRSKPALGAGDAAYIIAWCAWRKAEIQSCKDWSEDEARQRFARWWDEVGSAQLEQYGYRLLDTAGDTVTR